MVCPHFGIKILNQSTRTARQSARMLEMDSRISLQSLPDSDVFSPCSIDHQDVFMYDDDKHGPRCGMDGSDSPTFLDISNSKSASIPEIKTEPDTDTLMSWTQKHPEHWSQNEILDWIYFVASTIDVDPTTIRGEGFQNITGPELCRMTLDDFQRRDPVNGKCFFDMFRSLHRDAFFIEPADCDYTSSTSSMLHLQHEVKQEPKYNPCPYSSQEENFVTTGQGNDLQVLLGTDWYDIDTCVEINDEALEKISRQIFPHPDYGYGSSEYGSSDSESISDTSENTMDLYTRLHGRNDSTGSDVMSDDDYVPYPEPTKKKPATKRKVSKPGEQQKPQNRGRKPGQISKGNHLWEFIRDLLKDPKSNPHLLRWEEQETGVFRFVQSEAVAQMWGRKKNNPGMTYEKLSRAMRFCRTAGYFAEVPKTGKFPKKLCFRFGEKAFGWKD
ncbi:ETS-related transcription factor Elf-3-like isoform X2 [Ruditapes philippinarum]|uniref:ETS-related transcription factor Elf-3-like isoform X2 n=1 Tax=Ruditapes philippinarum TaxID=129788 RepID=UPI00295A6E57|nr:ETS-related transcription factor Elf-3-like isoform X2 [Ruditapes philippinarum]